MNTDLLLNKVMFHEFYPAWVLFSSLLLINVQNALDWSPTCFSFLFSRNYFLKTKFLINPKSQQFQNSNSTPAKVKISTKFIFNQFTFNQFTFTKTECSSKIPCTLFFVSSIVHVFLPETQQHSQKFHNSILLCIKWGWINCAKFCRKSKFAQSENDLEKWFWWLVAKQHLSKSRDWLSDDMIFVWWILVFKKSTSKVPKVKNEKHFCEEAFS